MEWDLTNLYLSPSDPQISKDKKKVGQWIDSFIKNFADIFNGNNLTHKIFLTAITDYQKILDKLYIYVSYTAYRKYQNTQSSNRAKLNQEAEEFFTKQTTKLLFFEIGIAKLDNDLFDFLLTNSDIKKYNNYLIHTRLFSNHTRNEKEEIIINKKNQTGRQAFIRLYEEQISALTYKININGKIKKLSYPEISTILTSDPSRELRQKASESMTATLSSNAKIFTYIQNTLLFDTQISDDIRNFSYPQQNTFIKYQIPADVVKTLTSTVSNSYDVVSEFYSHKRKALGLSKLTEIDRYSNLFEESDRKYTYTEAQEIILKAFKQFSPTFASIAKKFFDNNWIDAKPRKGKVAGAFCSYCVPNKNPYILINFNGKLRDITTLAHELGHGIHAYLSRKQPSLQYASSTAIAEIASVFCEAIVFEHLLKLESDNKIKANLLNNKIQEIFATVFRQNTFYLFESKLHTLRKTQGELSTSQINKLFQSEVQAMFKDSLTLSKGHQSWWMPVKHFFHYDFYVFSYVFGELLSLSLIGTYKQFGHKFVTNYIETLKTGGSLSPIDLTKMLGLNITKSDVWKKGLDHIQTYVKLYKDTTNTL